MSGSKSGNTSTEQLPPEVPGGAKESGTKQNPAPSEQERALAREAQLAYTKADYQACAAALARLEQLRPQDLKVTHNKIIVDYRRSPDIRRTDVLRKSLQAIAATGGQLQDTDALERCVLNYNLAVILYHTGQYRAALDISNSLFSLIEPMEEQFVHKVCLLLIELHLALNKTDIALTLVDYIENQCTSIADSSKSTLSEQSQKQDGVIKPNTRMTVATPEDKEQKKDSIDAATDAFKVKILKYKLRIYLKILQVNLAGEEWETLVSLGMPMDVSTIFLKANLEFLRKNFKQALSLLNSINNETCPDFKTIGESIPVLYYNNIASLHFAMGKPNLACYYLKAALDENKKTVDGAKLADNVNNLTDSSGQPVPLHAIKKNKHYELMYSLGVSFLYTSQATKAFDCFIEAAQQFHNESRLWLRMAECCIICHKSTNRVDFDISGRRKDIVSNVVGENGSTISRKYILASSLSKIYKYNPEGLSYAIPQPTLEYGMLCLKNALFLLQKLNQEELNSVLYSPTKEGFQKKVIGQQPQQSTLLGSLTPSSNHKLGHNTSAIGSSINSPHNPTNTKPCLQTACEYLNLKISILTASAYISLCLGDYVSALEYSKTLLKIKKLPGAQLLLGNLYAAESLIFLGRTYEALEYLKLDNLQRIDTYIPLQELVSEKLDLENEENNIFAEVIEQKPTKVSWYPTNVATAKSILQYNLAVAHAFRGELDRAGELLKQIWTSKGLDCDIPIHVIMLALYIELKLGHVDIARSLIKQHYCPPAQ